VGDIQRAERQRDKRDDYVTIYNTVVPAMLAVDPTIKLSAIEYSDMGWGPGWCDPMTYLPSLWRWKCGRGECAGGYCFDALLQQLRPDKHGHGADGDGATVCGERELFLRGAEEAQIWRRAGVGDGEQLNADYQGVNGMSTCNPNQVFVDDHRGTSAFLRLATICVFGAGEGRQPGSLPLGV